GSSCPQREIPQGQFTFVSVGNGSACAIRSDGTMKCWGGMFYPLSAIPAGSFSQVDVYIGACGVRSTGEAVCWGGEPTLTSAGGPFREAGAGEGMACALRVDGSFQCWGSANAGSTPQFNYESMSEGAYFMCGIESSAHTA